MSVEMGRGAPLYRRLVVGLCAVFVGVCAASAEMVDLNGADCVVSSAADLHAGGYTNSSATCATLTFSFDGACTVPTLAGNLRLVLDGGGTNTFAEAQSYTGGTIVSNATLVVTEACEFKGVGATNGTLTVAGGTVCCATRSSGRYHTNRSFVVPSGATGTIDVMGGSISIYVNHVDFRDATLVMASSVKTAYVWLQRGENNDKTWQNTGLATGGTFVIGRNVGLDCSAGDTFGGGSHNTDITLRVCDGGYVSVGGSHAPLTPKIILEGGAKLLSSEGSHASGSTVDALLNADHWLSTDFCGWVKVVPGASTNVVLVNMPNLHLAPTARDAFFDVAEGTIFEVDAQLWPSHGQSTRSLRKTGKGTLRLKRPLAIGGALAVEEGTVELAPHVMLGDVTGVTVADGAKLVLGDGSLWNQRSVPARAGGFLSTAEVWFDATTVRADEGAHVDGIRNLGTAGGSFKKFTANGRGLAPDTPTYTTNGINGLASLHFAGGSRETASWNSTDTPEALLLNTYTNNTDHLTFFIVFKWDGWEDDNYRYYKWHGPLSFSRATSYSTSSGCEDNNTPGSCDIQYGATFNTINFIYGYGGGSVSPGLDGSPTDENALLFRSVRSGTKATAGTWWSDTYPNFKTGTCTANVTHNIQCLNLGGRLMYGPQANSTRMLKGWIGELIVFSRDLTTDEDAYVTAYLKRKWFNSTVAAVAEPSAPVRTIQLTVAEDGIATYGGEDVSDNTRPDPAFERLEATGPGTLRFAGAAPEVGDITVSGGALCLNTAQEMTSEAALWFDPSDADAVVTNAEGRVVSVRNKGNLGGRFAQCPKSRVSTLCPLPALTNLNGYTAVRFDGNSALGIDCNSLTNQNGRRQMIVYGVLRRDSYVCEGGKGKWGGPFSFFQSTKGIDVSDYQTDYGLHYQEVTADTGDLNFAGKASSYTYPIADGTPYLFTFYAVDHDWAFGFGTVCADDATAMSNVVWTSTLAATSPVATPIPYDYLLLGGRLWGQRAAQWFGMDNSANRLWFGTIAEFIVFDRQPTNARLKELAAYLRRKWFNVGTGSTTAPAWLAGVAASAPETGVTVKGGAVLETEGETVALDALTLEDGATVSRLDVVTNADTFTLFDVTGCLSLAGSLTFRNTSFPQDGEVKLIGAGSVSGTATWTFAGAKNMANAPVKRRSDGLWFVRHGTMVFIR